MKKDDTLWKAILENVFDDFLRFFFEDADSIFNMRKGFQYLDKELEQVFPVEEVEAPRFVDKLVKVYTNSGKEKWILVHIEVQGYADKKFEERMFTYFYRIYDTYKKPVTAIALLTDSDKKFRPQSFVYDFMGTTLTYRFNVYKVADQNEEELALNNNVFAIIVLTVLLSLKSKNMSEQQLLNSKLQLARTLLKRKIPAIKVRNLLSFLKYYVHFGDERNNANFDTAVLSIANNKITMGIEEFLIDRAEKKGVAKGHEEATITFITNMLSAGKFTITEIAGFAGVTEAFVRKIKKQNV